MTVQDRCRLEAEVLEFVLAEIPPPRPRSIGPHTQLERDLRLAWDDAEDVLAKFFGRFGIDHTGFDATSYFTTSRPLFSFRKRSARVKPLTIGMLIDAAEAKTWAITTRSGDE